MRGGAWAGRGNAGAIQYAFKSKTGELREVRHNEENNENDENDENDDNYYE